MKTLKKAVVLTMSVIIIALAIMIAPENTVTAKAASSKDVYINPYSDRVVNYVPKSNYVSYSAVISIVGCSKKSEIKNLKSSNKDIKVRAEEGYIVAEYGNKAGKATITCTVKNVKLKTTLTVLKYTNPLKEFKLGKNNYTSKYNNSYVFNINKAVKNQNLSIKAKSGWKIVSVYVSEGNGKGVSSYKELSKFSTKISLKEKYSSYVYVKLYNKKSDLYVSLNLDLY